MLWCPAPSERCGPALRHLEALLARGLPLAELEEALEVIRWRERAKRIEARCEIERRLRFALLSWLWWAKERKPGL